MTSIIYFSLCFFILSFRDSIDIFCVINFVKFSECISGKDFFNKYLCFLLFNENNKLVGTEYINIETVSAGQTKTYELKFKRDGVKKFYLILTDDDSELNLEELM